MENIFKPLLWKAINATLWSKESLIKLCFWLENDDSAAGSVGHGSSGLF